MKRILFMVVCACVALAGACMKPEAIAVQAPVPTVTAAATPAPTVKPTPVPTPTATPVPTATPEPTRITVMAVGDLMCLRGQINAAHSSGGYDFGYVFAGVKDIISSADLAIGNFETLIAEGLPLTFNSSEPGVGPLINGPEAYLRAVAEAGFDVLSNGNNHINDQGVEGIQKTLEQLDAYGIYHAGAYATEEEKAPLIVHVQGIKIGIVAYTDHLNRSSGGNKALIDLYTDDRAAADIAAAREAGAEFIIAYIHWGKENTHKVVSWQRSTAQFLADSGADLILGSHPHCVQEFELLETAKGSVPVFYSLGNFTSSMTSRPMNRDGVIFKFVLEKNNVTGEVTLGPLSYIPTYCTRTSGGSFAVVSADAASAEGSSSLTKSRERTIGVLGEEIAQPE